MKRFLCLSVLAMLILVFATPADARHGGWGHRGHGYHSGWGRAAGWAAAGAILGGVIASSRHHDRGYYRGYYDSRCYPAPYPYGYAYPYPYAYPAPARVYYYDTPCYSDAPAGRPSYQYYYYNR
ncbi:MAG: hypothetical protein HY815_04595 [Candidatus Riflebacteria bacterium]|nr:hypothetical protein [Candidatus Riflebacteria bacterium]